MSAVIHLSDPDHGPSYCGEPVTIIETEGDTRPICQACHRGIAKRLRRMVDEYRNEAVDLREAEVIERVRTIAFDPDTISALEYGVVRDGPHSGVGVSQGEAIGYAVDALRELRTLLPDTPTTERSTS